MVSDLFACRDCHRLAYASQNDSDRDPALNKLQRIKMRMGGTGSIFERFPPRPKGTHRQTYERLRRVHHVAESAWLRPYEILRQLEIQKRSAEQVLRKPERSSKSRRGTKRSKL
jgi:hypothetical protein